MKAGDVAITRSFSPVYPSPIASENHFRIFGYTKNGNSESGAITIDRSSIFACPFIRDDFLKNRVLDTIIEITFETFSTNL